MSITQRIENLKNVCEALRSACDSVLMELEAVNLATASTPRARQNRKNARVGHYEKAYATGRITKPNHKIKNATSGN